MREHRFDGHHHHFQQGGDRRQGSVFLDGFFDQTASRLALGKPLKEIAAELSLSEKTIGTYRMRISQKIGLSTNVELARYALQHKLVD